MKIQSVSLTLLAALALTVSSQSTVVRASGAGPVVVELFTSQGCSSCPSADRLLSNLRFDPRWGNRVIPLSFHVDYWNSIGWEDPFSSAAWTARQRAYAKALGNGNRVYTPQLVVNGRRDCVGSAADEVMNQIDSALDTRVAGRVRLKLPPGDTAGAVKVGIDAQLDSAAKHNLDVVVALYQNGLSTAVPRGENAKRTLKNDYVVRRFEKAFSIPAAAGSRQTGEISLALDPSWKRSDLGVVAFLQDPISLEIHGAANLPLKGR
jgi:hypothetical protein